VKNQTKLWGFIGLGFWFAINTIQAALTLLSHDEAYYWMYSRYLDWGYFDHPPAIAVAIKIGYFFIQSELGVRIISVILSTLTIYLLLKICNPEKVQVKLFFLIVFSIPLVHAGGFLATPDVPFIFFTTCFFYVYKSYIEDYSWKKAILLALVMSLLLYSKYHGALVIFFTIISNINILTKKTFWVAGVLALILFLPHLIWQLNHDFPSIKYHLFERSRGVFKIDYVLEYIGGQFLILGPLSGIVLFVASLKNKDTSLFTRTLKFTLIGFFLFFLLNSFKSRVEANWTSAAFIPLIILSFYTLKENTLLRKWMINLAVPVIILIIAARVVLMLEELPLNIKAKSEFHLWDKWANQIKEKAEGAPVVFMNSYQKASKYTYYTGEFAYSLNNFMYRKNQYDIWPFEDSLQGKKVFIIPNYPTQADSFRTAIGEKYNFRFIENFRSYNKVKIKVLNEKEIVDIPEDTVTLSIELKNIGSYTADFTSNPELPSNLCVNIYHKGIYQSTQLYPLKTSVIKPNEKFEQEIKFITRKEEGDYNFRVAIFTGWLPYGLNSDLNELKVKKAL